jgi:hypothetical protein
MDHFVSALATHPMTLVGHTAMAVTVEKRVNTAVTIIVYVDSSIKEIHPEVQFCVFILELSAFVNNTQHCMYCCMYILYVYCTYNSAQKKILCYGL